MRHQKVLRRFPQVVMLLTIWQVAGVLSEPIQETPYNQNSPKIVIVGAGPSGIACATKLLDYGFENVVILEAEPRIGGRIHTIPFGENVIDLGAQWCHGEKDNIVYELAHEHNLLESTGYYQENCVRSNREVVPESICLRLRDILHVSHETHEIELRHFNGSLGSYLTNKFDEALGKPENSDIDMTIAREFFENYKKIENSWMASDSVDEVSGRGLLEYWISEGDNLLNWKGKGYLEFLRLLMKSHETGTDLGVLEKHVRLSKGVKEIHWNRNDSSVEIKCDDGEVLTADHVIVTVSLGVLKEQHEHLFEPQLPEEKRRAIDGLAFGTVNKLFLEFPEQFWPTNWTGFTLLWRNEDLKEIRGTPRAWLEDVSGFYPESYQPRMLSGWITGPNARHMETLPKDEVLAGCMYLFRKFLQWEIPEPVNFKRSAWSTNPHFRGSYSFRSMITEEKGISATDLAKPLTMGTTMPNDHAMEHQSNHNKPIVQFAGEATSAHRYSTVHGAVETGFREAKRLADFYRRKHNPN